MVICDDCKFCNLGCIHKDATIANKNSQCKFRSVLTMEKTAESKTSTVSWPVGNKTRVQVHIGGKIISDKIKT